MFALVMSIVSFLISAVSLLSAMATSAGLEDLKKELENSADTH